MTTAAKTGGDITIGTEEEVNECLNMINEARKQMRKKPLTLDKALSDITLPHSKNMAKGSVVIGNDGMRTRINKSPKKLMKSMERVAASQGSANPIKEITSQWVDRATTTGDYTVVGISFAHNAEGKWCGTMLLGKY